MIRASFALYLILLVSPGNADSGSRTLDIRIQTGLGDIVVELYQRDAPVTVANFLWYVDAGHYRGGRFHRTVKPDNQPSNTVKIEVIQGGVNPAYELLGINPIRMERTVVTGIRHMDGTISMARLEPDSATSDFFICIGDQPELDFNGKRNPDGQGFAAFGRVIKGMKVVRTIQSSSSVGQALTPSVEIRRIVRTPDRFERLYE